MGTRAAVNDNDTSAGNPFSAIVERNVFALKDPPPPPPLEVKTNTPPPNIRLTGITTIFGTSNKRALFMVQEVGIPGKPAGKEESYILTEGQRQGPIEVVEIDEKHNSVKIKNDGNEAVLTLDEKVKLPSAPAIPGLGAPLPGGLPRLPTAGVTPAGSISPISLYGNNKNNNNYNTPVPAASVELPLRTIRTPPAAAPVTGPVPSPEEQIIMIEAQREANKNNPRFPPLPPTPLTPILQGEQNQQPAGGEAPPPPP